MAERSTLAFSLEETGGCALLAAQVGTQHAKGEGAITLLAPPGRR